MRYFNHVFWSVVIVTATIGLFGIVRGICRYSEANDAFVDNLPIVYDVETTETTYYSDYSVSIDRSVFVDDFVREVVAKIVAGRAGDKPMSIQMLVANVVRNCYLMCDRDIDKAVLEYDLHWLGEPTDETYEAVDNVFGGQLFFDYDVLYIDRDAEDFIFVCEYRGICFYRERWS